MNIETLRTGLAHLGDSGNDPKIPPKWMDLERFRRGQQFFLRHTFAACFALHCSLTVLFGVSSIDKALIYTRNSDTARKSIIRYLKTFVHIVLWHTDDVWDENTKGHRSVQRVRKMHGMVRNAMAAQDPKEIHVSQYDMALVQAGFMAVVAMYPWRFGIKCTKEELADYVFFWRGIGYLLGIRDEYNLCSGSYDDFYRVGKEIEHENVYRGISSPPKEFDTLTNAYIDGVNSLVHFRAFTRESVIVFTFRIMRLPIPDIKLTWTDSLRIFLIQVLVFIVRWVPFVEGLLNSLVLWLFALFPSTESGEFAKESEHILDNAVSAQ